MIDVLKVQKHLADLYSQTDITEEEIQKLLKKYPDREKLWNEELKDFTTDEVIQAINEYWRYKNSEIKPKIVHIKAMLLPAKKDEVVEVKTKDYSGLAKAAEKTAEELRRKALERFGNA